MNTVTITLTPQAQALLARMQSAPAALPAALAAALDQQNELTVGYIQRNKLSRRGPTTLGVRTNRLRLSIRPSPAVVSGNTITSSIGSNVRYAGVHEFGFRGRVQVREHKRRLIAFDRYERQGKRLVQTQSGLPGRIRSHVREVSIPERAFIRSSLAERAAIYGQRLSRAIILTLTGGRS